MTADRDANHSDSRDRQLVRAALDGSREALDELVRRHQGFVYGVALRMLWNQRDAEDAAQEILVKMVTKLSSFRGDSSFKAWVYRIAANHMLDVRRSRAEMAVGSFADFGLLVDQLPDGELDGDPASEAENRVLVEETRVACLTGMLLCLDRRQRLPFILSEVFEVDHAVGGAILEISPANYRQRLSRARRQLYAFMRGRCGLADPANPCRCPRKTRAAVARGIVNPITLRFVDGAVARVRQGVVQRSRELRHLVDEGYAYLYRQPPLEKQPDLVEGIRTVLADRRFRAVLDLGSEES